MVGCSQGSKRASTINHLTFFRIHPFHTWDLRLAILAMDASVARRDGRAYLVFWLLLVLNGESATHLCVIVCSGSERKITLVSPSDRSMGLHKFRGCDKPPSNIEYMQV